MSSRVLLVSDDERFINALAAHLKGHSLAASAATGSQEGLAFVQEHDVDVVVLDLHRPGIEQLATIREIKWISPLTEVLVLAGQGTMEIAVRAMKLGAHDYLGKPTDTQELVTKIAEARRFKAAREERIKRAEVDRLVQERGRRE